MSLVRGFSKIAYTRTELKELVPEHKKLVRVLRHGSKKQREEEASKQKAESKEYEKKLRS